MADAANRYVDRKTWSKPAKETAEYLRILEVFGEELTYPKKSQLQPMQTFTGKIVAALNKALPVQVAGVKKVVLGRMSSNGAQTSDAYGNNGVKYMYRAAIPDLVLQGVEIRWFNDANGAMFWDEAAIKKKVADAMLLLALEYQVESLKHELYMHILANPIAPPVYAANITSVPVLDAFDSKAASGVAPVLVKSQLEKLKKDYDADVAAREVRQNTLLANQMARDAALESTANAALKTYTSNADCEKQLKANEKSPLANQPSVKCQAKHAAAWEAAALSSATSKAYVADSAAASAAMDLEHKARLKVYTEYAAAVAAAVGHSPADTESVFRDKSSNAALADAAMAAAVTDTTDYADAVKAAATAAKTTLLANGVKYKGLAATFDSADKDCQAAWNRDVASMYSSDVTDTVLKKTLDTEKKAALVEACEFQAQAAEVFQSLASKQKATAKYGQLDSAAVGSLERDAKDAKADVQESKAKQVADAAKIQSQVDEADASTFPMMVVVIAAGVLILLCIGIAMYVVVSTGGSGGANKQAQGDPSQIAFENPVYAGEYNQGYDQNQYGGQQQQYGAPAEGLYGGQQQAPQMAQAPPAGDAGDLYDEPEMQPTAGGAGYLDVQPDDDDDDSDDDSVDESDGDDDDDDAESSEESDDDDSE